MILIYGTRFEAAFFFFMRSTTINDATVAKIGKIFSFYLSSPSRVTILHRNVSFGLRYLSYADYENF